MNQEQLESTPALNPVVSQQEQHRFAPTHALTILLVEDDQTIREITALLLETLHYEVITAASGAEALEKFYRNLHSIDVLLTDIVMPQMSGPQLARDLLKANPNLKIVFMSGYSAGALPGNTAEHFLPKPFTREMLRKKLDEALDGRTPQVVAH